MAQFEPAYHLTSLNEGGYQKDPNDPGNYNSRDELVGTKFGISARFYERILGRPPSETDMRDLTKADAKAIYKDNFWRQYRIGEIHSQKIANQVFDMFINHAPGTAISFIRDALNKYGYDRQGDDWRESINRAITQGNEIKVNNAIAREREKFMRNNAPTGWASILINRARKYYIDNPGFAVLAIFLTSLPVIYS